MFLAAAPYFASRFEGNDWIKTNFQSAILTVSTIANLTSLLVLTKIQQSASYPFRINTALTINIVVFSLLTTSAATFLDASPAAYFAFLLLAVAAAALAAGLFQNGAFAFAASFGRPEYMQGLMTGQAVAGVLPPVAQVTMVLLFPPVEEASRPDHLPSTSRQSSAFLYFLAAVVISVVALVAFVPLVRRHDRIIENRMVEHMAESMASIEEAERAARRVTSLWRLFVKLHWLALGVALTFAETMFFPVFTVKILSVQENAGALFQPAAFIPMAFFFWNAGDFSGRMATMLPFTLKHRPLALFLLSVLRICWLPLYLLCNINGRGAVIPSDLFYLIIVQVLFGLSNGWLGSSCMMASGLWVDDVEREAAGSFMVLCIVVGLSSGSLLSFTISGI